MVRHDHSSIGGEAVSGPIPAAPAAGGLRVSGSMARGTAAGKLVTSLDLGPWLVTVVPIGAAGARLAAGDRLSDWFGPDEFERISAFPVEKRRREWAAGRIAAKAALIALHAAAGRKAPPANGVRVFNVPDGAEKGRPVASIEGEVAISHSGAVAVAVASESRIGVDVERIRRFDDHVIRSVFTSRERVLLDRGLLRSGRDAGRTLLWTFKEAYMKAHGQGVFGRFHDVELNGAADDGRLDWWSCAPAGHAADSPDTGHARLFQGYALTVVGSRPASSPDTHQERQG